MEADRRRLNLWVEAEILLAGLWEGRNHSHGSLSFVSAPLPVDFVHSSFWATDSQFKASELVSLLLVPFLFLCSHILLLLTFISSC